MSKRYPYRGDETRHVTRTELLAATRAERARMAESATSREPVTPPESERATDKETTQ